MPDHYRTLGISRDATADEIKKAYRKAAMKYHPDKNPDNKEAAAAKFKTVGQAYACLSDPEKKQFYDRWGEEEPQRPSPGQRGHAHMDPSVDEFFNAFFGFQPQRRRHTQSQQGGQQQQQGQAPAAALMMQFLPILLLAFISIWSGGSSFGRDETPFTFGRNSVYRYQLETASGISYYVQPDTYTAVTRDPSTRDDMERKVDQSWRRRLHTDCQFQMRQKSQLQQHAEILNDQDKMQKARDYPLHSCDELRTRYNQHPGDQRYSNDYRYRSTYRV